MTNYKLIKRKQLLIIILSIKVWIIYNKDRMNDKKETIKEMYKNNDYHTYVQGAQNRKVT